MNRLIELIRNHCQPLEPRATDTAPQLVRLPNVRAVLFDIYGTLMISGSGDIGSDRADHRQASLQAVADLFDIELSCSAQEANEAFATEVRAEHARLKASGTTYPEVDFREIWSRVLSQIANPTTAGAVDSTKFSLEFELRVNPTWPMPAAESTLDELRQRDLMLGIVSNAQFFTPLLFSALMERDLEGLGVSSELTYFSFEHRQAKPGTALYDLAKSKLAELGIGADQVLYVGNDMLNDVTAASQVGFRTALFAGDQRSLRMRSDDERVHGVKADIVVTELPQLIECLS